MNVAHLELAEANAYVTKHHRHHKPVTGHRFSIGAIDEWGWLCGAAICGRPVARKTDQRNTVEVLRLCTDGTPNACSFLYMACVRAARALGYARVQTFILQSEPGTSLKSMKEAGWREEIVSPGRNWNVPSRGGRRVDQPMVPKVRWGVQL